MLWAHTSCEGQFVADGTQWILFCYDPKLVLKCTEQHLLKWLLGLAQVTVSRLWQSMVAGGFLLDLGRFGAFE